MKETLYTISEWLVLAMVPPATLFPLLYATFARWYRRPIGRALMTKATGMALLVDLSALQIIVDLTYPLLVTCGVYTLVCVGLWYQFAVFCRIKFTNRKESDPS